MAARHLLDRLTPPMAGARHWRLPRCCPAGSTPPVLVWIRSAALRKQPKI